MQSPLESYTNVDAKREPILEEGENALYTQKRVEFYRDVSKSEGMGTLYVTSKKVVWIRDQDTDEMQTDSEEKVAPGYAIDFHSIMMHAIARPGTFSEFERACIYCQLDSEEEDGTHEIRLAPEDASTLDAMYKALSEGALLNPDPVEEDEGEFFYNKDEVELGAKQAATLQHLESVFVEPMVQDNTEPGQFDDAEEPEQ